MIWKTSAVAQLREKEGKMLFHQKRESESRSTAVESEGWVMRRLEIQCHCVGIASCDPFPLASQQHSRKMSSCLPRVVVVPVFIPRDITAIKPLVHKTFPNTHIYYLHERQRAIIRRKSIQVTKVSVIRWNIPRRQTLSPQPLSSQPAHYRHSHVSHLPGKWILRSSDWLSLKEILASQNTWIYKAPMNPKHLLQTRSLP